MSTKFEPITISEFDDELTEPSAKSPVHRRLYLRLSDTPTDEWEQFFYEQRRSHMHSKTRHSTIEGGYLVVDCPPNELKNQHEELKGDLVAVNAKYNDWLRSNTAGQKVAESAQIEERNKLKQIKSGLNFE